MGTDQSGEVVACPRCRNDLPVTATFCRRCGRAQGRDPVTRAVRTGLRAARRKPDRALFGVALFFGLAAMLVLLVAVRTRAARAASDAVARAAERPPVTFPAPASPPTPSPRPRFSPTPVPAPPRTARAMPASAANQLSLRWTVSGDRLDCTVTNNSAWQVQEVCIAVNVWTDQRLAQGGPHRIPINIAPGASVRANLPLGLEFKPGYGLECRVMWATGFQP